MSSTSSIRTSIRLKRQSLAPETNRRHGTIVAATLDRIPAYRKSKRVGIYLAVNGELDTSAIIDSARGCGKELFLPVLHPFLHGQLLFCRWDEEIALVKNRYGIDEPVCTSRSLASLRSLDLVIVPLVAFDRDMNRIGMGGGYYDRTFGYVKRLRHWRRPSLVGVAHQFQHVEMINASQWDVPLDTVVTEHAVYTRR